MGSSAGSTATRDPFICAIKKRAQACASRTASVSREIYGIWKSIIRIHVNDDISNAHLKVNIKTIGGSIYPTPCSWCMDGFIA